MAPTVVRRLFGEPIIRPDMDQRMGDNINGPSLIRVPEWVERPLGRYYLYFGHHRGTYIRLAYADSLGGPWRMHEPGVLDLRESLFEEHIASPDVLVDDARREIRLYFHGLLGADDRQRLRLRNGAQGTRMALSGDGLTFRVRPEILGGAYFRLFVWNGWHYAIAMPGWLYRSRDGLTAFERGHNPFAEIAPLMRHVAVLREGETLRVFYSNRGDAPERVLCTRLDLSEDWTRWRAAEPEVVLEPELPYEGALEALIPSEAGPIEHAARQLRDPAIFQEDGRTYLLYTVAGEQGIGAAELDVRD